MMGWIDQALANETNYLCPVTLSPAQPGGTRRHIISGDAFSNGTKNELLQADSIDKKTGDGLVHMEGTRPPYGLWCQYDDKSELIINLPYTDTITLCRYSRAGFSCK